MKTTSNKTTFYFNLGTKYFIIFYLVTSDLSQRNYKSSETLNEILSSLQECPPRTVPVLGCSYQAK